MAKISKEETQNYIEKVALLAQKEVLLRKNNGRNWSLPSVCIAQSILETGWGKSSIMAKANAYFGIKSGRNWKGPVYSTKTKEWYNGVDATNITDTFRAYATLEDSIKDYFALICEYGRYAKACNTMDARQCVQGIKDGGYSTYPTYVNEVMTLINSYNLTKYDTILNNAENKVVKEPPVDREALLNKVVDDVINNKYGSGEMRKQKLEAEGFDYREVQGRVNKKLRESNPRPSINYYPKFIGKSSSITSALNAVGCNDTSMNFRKEIAVKNKIVPLKFMYKGTASQNTEMLRLLKAGKLIKP